ncbi:tyrosine-type recombinase/integrase [Muriicola sp. Z0-33]|uniref:tyrosine-type recombinase/integrase n=1 Tax=Muriicola sp. Z0-33 TaxID=2816957 RepID=UPI0022385F75|nr:tyrosine-type recombinase/integrase [Muriicola sp. Z0-33]MCW5517765.1 tyrosine-type recombinase/integrase [Muriicola sp. Z0-33]
MSVNAFISYLAQEKNYSAHTIKAYNNDINDFKSFCTDNYDFGNIETVDYGIIRSWIVQLVETGISNRSVNRKVASLKAYYKFLLMTDSITASPLARHKALKTSKKIEIPFSESEMERMFQEVPFENDFEGIRDKLIIELLYTTGIRRSELINLKLTDINLHDNSIKVLGKRNKERIIPLLHSIGELFETYFQMRKTLNVPREQEYVFLSKGGHKIYETLVYRIINGYFSMVSSKVKRSPHILRHTFATHLLNKGADMNAVKELLGHSSLASTQVYTHNSIAELKKVHSSSHPRSQE